MAFLIKGAHVVDPTLQLDDIRDVVIIGSSIVEVGVGISAQDMLSKYGITEQDIEIIDASGKYLVPGLVDMHVHFRDPGFEYKETIETGSQAAVHGGFTDVATMPNTSPVTDTGAEVRYQIERATLAGLCHVHPIGSLTREQKGESLAEIGDMVREGAPAFSDDGHGVQSAGMMRTCMEYVSQFDRVAIAHCEDESLTAHGVINEGRASTRLGMFGMPALGEEIEIWRDIQLCKTTGCPLHIAHISTARGLDMVRQAKQEGLPVSCEVTPHHLFLHEDMISDAYDTNYKMSPPLRTADDAAALRAGLIDGSVDCVATDHAPHATHEKDCEWEIAYFGIIGLETAVPLLVSQLINTGLLSWNRFVEALCIRPREILRLPQIQIASGNNASITLIDPNRDIVVTPEWIASKSKNTPFMGQTMRGYVSDVFVDGWRCLTDGELTPRLGR